VVYSFAAGKITPERLIHLPLQQLAPGRKTSILGDVEGDKGVPFPAAIAVVGAAGAEKLLVADNLSDDVLLLDAASGAIERRFDLSESNAVPGTYPEALAVSKDGRAFVALWNASEIAELDLARGTAGRKLALLKPASDVAPGTHPCALELSPDGKVLYVCAGQPRCCCGRECGSGAILGEGLLRYATAGQSYFGAEPRRWQ